MQGLKLLRLLLLTDEILEILSHTQDITNKIDCFFKDLHVLLTNVK